MNEISLIKLHTLENPDPEPVEISDDDLKQQTNTISEIVEDDGA